MTERETPDTLATPATPEIVAASAVRETPASTETPAIPATSSTPAARETPDTSGTATVRETPDASTSATATAPTAREIAAAPTDHPAFDAFVATIAALRAPDGCPWDREQTHASIAQNMIEEAYEAVDAIEANDVPHLREELGDVLLQVVLQSQIAADAGEFTIDEVCADVNAKMIRRHPHVFGEAQAKNATEVLDLWDQVKLAEREAAGASLTAAASTHADAAATATAPADSLSCTQAQMFNAHDSATATANASAPTPATAARTGLLDGVPKAFPALMQAQKVSRKVAAVGFEWEDVDAVWAKVNEEIQELKEAYACAPKGANGKVDSTAVSADMGKVDGTVVSAGTRKADSTAVSAGMSSEEAQRAIDAVRMEAGDVLFSLVNVLRKMGIDAEGALRDACGKFRRRWAFMEGVAWAQGCSVEDLSADELEMLWEQAKTLESSKDNGTL